jgi:hypothetical protein
MPTWAYLTIAIVLIVILLVVFIVSFVLYKRTPAPKGCENLLPSSEKCSKCKETGCHFNIYADKEDKK